MKGFIGPVEPAAIQPLLTCEQTEKRDVCGLNQLSSSRNTGPGLTAGERRLTGVVLPQTFDIDDVRLEVRLCRLHIHVVSHVVHAVFKAAVLTVRALGVGLPRPPG